MLTKPQTNALELLCQRKYPNVLFKFGQWYFRDTDDELVCGLCLQIITCSCKEPHPGRAHKLSDVLEEHGIEHLKDKGLLIFS